MTRKAILVLLLAGVSACASSGTSYTAEAPLPAPAGPPRPDPRVGLRAGLFNAQEAAWNMRLVSNTPPSAEFLGKTNSDIAFSGNYVIQGNYHGYQVWDISNPAQVRLAKAFVCPESQSDVSVFRNLLFVSGEGFEGRLDCGPDAPREHVSHDRLRGIRIFDISDWNNPRQLAAVQTCRGSHTHTVLVPQNDNDNVYVYVSGSSPVRPEGEMAGCTSGLPGENPNTALFRIEVIKVPLANPAQARIVSSPRIFQDLTAPATHGLAPQDLRDLAAARARGAYVAEFGGQQFILPDQMTRGMLDSIARARGATAVTGADSAQLRRDLPAWVLRVTGQPANAPAGPRPGPTQCHDITVYPAVGLAGGACEGYGFLLDISNPEQPVRVAAVSDSNFSYWHSATFNNDGTKILFSDEWGGGGGPKCRADDPMTWGANAIFTIENRRELRFRSYYKMPAAQTSFENCVAHNGSMLPIPGRDIMAQAWYQGGVSVFEWTDPDRPMEIAFFDRGPADSTRMGNGGTWSVYWYNGVIVSSEIARGLDVFELTPSGYISQNEIDAAKSVRMDFFNTQGQPRFVWPPSFALARAYTDQLERSRGLANVADVRRALQAAERNSGSGRADALTQLAARLDTEAASSRDAAKVRMLIRTVSELAR
jgi:hypothetical protein